MKKIFACIVLLHSPLWAAEKNSQAANGTTKAEEKSTTIYFQPPPSQNVYILAPNLTNKKKLKDYNLMMEKIENSTLEENNGHSNSLETDAKELVKFIANIKNAMCSVNSGGLYEVWLAGTVGGKWVITAEANGGIKAIIPCSPETTQGTETPEKETK